MYLDKRVNVLLFYRITRIIYMYKKRKKKKKKRYTRKYLYANENRVIAADTYNAYVYIYIYMCISSRPQPESPPRVTLRHGIFPRLLRRASRGREAAKRAYERGIYDFMPKRDSHVRRRIPAIRGAPAVSARFRGERLRGEDAVSRERARGRAAEPRKRRDSGYLGYHRPPVAISAAVRAR